MVSHKDYILIVDERKVEREEEKEDDNEGCSGGEGRTWTDARRRSHIPSFPDYMRECHPSYGQEAQKGK